MIDGGGDLLDLVVGVMGGDAALQGDDGRREEEGHGFRGLR